MGPLKDGKWGQNIGLPREFFESQNIDLDCRGPLEIDKDSHWGWDIKVYTLTHNIGAGVAGGWGIEPLKRGVTVCSNAWIGSGAILYNCTIGENAVVAAGTVVRSAEVKPNTMVAGNPARVIARFKDGRWVFVGNKYEVLE